MSTELKNALLAAGPRLVDRVLAEMYENPFWVERFGARAHTHGREDGLYHITYACNAIEAGDVGVIENYARWLQQVLTTRGMCSRHLADNFDRLAAAIRDEPWPGKQAAIDVFAAAARALHYEDSIAGGLQARTMIIARAATLDLHANHPDGPAADQARCIDDLSYHLSYLADAIALSRPQVFGDYIRWLGEFLAKRSVPRTHLAASLDALEAQIAKQFPAAVAPCAAAFAQARAPI